MPLLNDMALFVEVVKARSFRRAAVALAMPNSTLSRRIGRLEKDVGLRLLNRTTRKIDLTEAGLIYFERCKRIVEEANLAHEQLGEMLAQPSGMLRVSLSADFGLILLAPVIAEFARQYPLITFEFDLTPRLADLISEPIDVAIRMGESPNSGLITRFIVRLPRYLYASPEYLKRAGEPREPADLAVHECLRLRTAEAGQWTLQHEVQSTQVSVAVGGRFLLNSVGMIQRLATLNLGIALLSQEAAANDVACGRLRRLLPEWKATPISVYAITETRLLPAKTQRFIDFLQERLAHR